MLTFCETHQLSKSTFCLIYDALGMNQLPSGLLSSRCRYNLAAFTRKLDASIRCRISRQTSQNGEMTYEHMPVPKIVLFDSLTAPDSLSLVQSDQLHFCPKNK